MKKIGLSLLVILLLAVMAFGGYQIYRGLHTYSKIDAYYEAVGETYVSQKPSASPTASQKAPAVSSARNDVERQSVSTAETETTTPIETAPITVDFDALLSDSPDVVGWLYSMDGQVNLPVVQGDDNVYYLTHLPDGTELSGGSLFLDYLCSPDFSLDIQFIYGHNMKNGSMLQPILDYQSQSYYDSYPYLYLLTPEKNYKLKVFAGVLTDMESDIYTFSFQTEQEKTDFIASLAAQSDFVPLELPTAQARILGLSTCAYDYKNARYVVFASLEEIG